MTVRLHRKQTLVLGLALILVVASLWIPIPRKTVLPDHPAQLSGLVGGEKDGVLLGPVSLIDDRIGLSGLAAFSDDGAEFAKDRYLQRINRASRAKE
ncbi:MAG TPA: hypothetical protein PK880_14010 [Candidatus Competibacter sp.]|nr:hypothetical protein [Candidatus Competibacteraceae bacterium]HRC73625.1 hypothetical protein [Candidatus Competibacter sp.]